MREIVCRNNGRFSLEGNGEEVSAKVILNLKSTVDGVIVENMQNYDILLLKVFFMIACLVTSNSKIKIQSSDSKNIKEITKVDLDEILASHSTEWVYIGRPLR